MPTISLLPQGLYPHDLGACEDLSIRIRELVHDLKPSQPVLLVTGDLTTRGAASEFALALTYLRGELYQSWSTTLGLLGPFSKTFMIPGNHDHWNGSVTGAVFHHGATTSAVHGTYFVGPFGQPWWHETLEQQGIQLQLMGLDSCSRSTFQVAARGYIDLNSLSDLANRITMAEQRAAARGLRSIRVLLIHHSPSYQAKRSFRWFKEMDPSSCQALEDFCKAHRIHFVLTGHVHTPFVPSPRTQHSWGTELRCGTTLQGAPLGKLPSPNGNVFLTHALWLQDTTPHWRTSVYQRRYQLGFRENTSLRYEITLP